MIGKQMRAAYLSLACFLLTGFAQEKSPRDIPGNGAPIEGIGPFERYGSIADELTRQISGRCDGHSLRVTTVEGFDHLRFKNIVIDGQEVNIDPIRKYGKIFRGSKGAYIRCAGSAFPNVLFHFHFTNYSFTSFYDYWACTLGGPVPSDKFGFHFHVLKNKQIGGAYVWPIGRMFDNLLPYSFNGDRTPYVDPDDPDSYYPDCEKYEETGFPITLED